MPRPAPSRLALLALFAVNVAAAQAGRLELTFADAVSRAESSPDLVVARAAQVVAERAIAVAGAPQAPTFTTSTHSATSRLGLALSAPLRWGGQRSAAVDVARAERDAAVAEAAAALDRARELVSAAWFRLAVNEELEALARARVERVERTAGAVKDLFDAGRVPRVDSVKAQAEAAAARADVFAASAERWAASAELAFLVGLSPSTEIAASGERPAVVAMPDLGTLLAKAATSAPMQAAEARGRAAAARLTKARREGLPALTLEGGAEFDDPTQEGTDKHLALGLTIPIGARAAVRVSSAELDRDAAERAKLRRSIEEEVVGAWHRVEAARRRLDALDRFTIPAAQEAAELSRLAYREGRLELLRLLESERALLDVQTNRVEAWALWGTQRATLARLVGGRL